MADGRHQANEILKHLLRTFALVVGIAAILLLLGKYLPPQLYPFAMIVVVGAVVVLSGRRHAVWAPVADRVDHLKWKDEKDRQFESIVELAKVHAATQGGADVVKSEILRVSVYSLPKHKRKVRTLIGEAARYLGQHGRGFWFYIPDAYHARRDGLVCVDPKNGTFVYHLPKTEFEMGKREKGRPAVISIERKGKQEDFDLGQAL